MNYYGAAGGFDLEDLENDIPLDQLNWINQIRDDNSLSLVSNVKTDKYSQQVKNILYFINSDFD